nr:efflux transporter outer membrane subunit [Rhizobium sp. AG207R]
MIFAAIGTLSSCVDAPISPPVADMPKAFLGAARADNPAHVNEEWWQAFGDPELNKLMDLGKAKNPEIVQAAARLEQARANVDLASADLLPAISGGVGSARGDKYGLGTTSGSYGTASGSWTMDLFGGKRAQKRAAQARFDAAISDVDETTLNVLSSIGSTYVDVRYYQEQIALVRLTVENRSRNLAMMRDSRDAGQTSQLQIVQAEQLVAKADAELPSLEVQLDDSIATLGSLTGASEQDLHAELSTKTHQPRPRYKIGIGIPTDVIRNRPDVRRAESNFIAAAEGVGIAKAALYPSLELSGYVTPTAVVHSGHVNIWQIAANFTMPIFDGGKNKANLASAKAQLQQAEAAWQAAVLNGIAAVEKALAAYNRDGRNIAAQEKLAATSKEALRLGRVSFDLGAGAVFNILDAERDYLEAQQSRAQAIRDQALHYIELCKAAPPARRHDASVTSAMKATSSSGRPKG